MLKLPDVTLCMIETRQHDLAQLALEDCERRAQFGDVLVFTDRPSQFMRADRRVVSVEDWPDKVGWSQCFWYDVSRHLQTTHVLGAQWDSWIVDPSMWRDEYLDYDYVGAPWPFHKDGMAVGNGGFSLRSTKLLRFIYKHRDRFPCITDVDDDLYCRRYRPALQDEGFVWAPENLAYDFAFECGRPDPTARHFGFHAVFNFDYGCENNEERLLERARIMARSDYVTKRATWDGFAKKHPQIIHKLKEVGNG
jgi:Protein of unknown function (DUF5672)